MASQSKMIFDSFSALLLKALFGSTRKRAVTASILVIIGFLLYIRNKKSSIENLKLSKLSIKESDVIRDLCRKGKETSTLCSMIGSRNS